MGDFVKERKSPLLMTDIIIEKNGKIILIVRNKEPFKGELSIPGGFVEWGETVEHAAVREAKEETGLDVRLIDIVGVYSDPKRDPRGSAVSVLFAAELVGGKLKGGDDAKEANWFDLSKTKNLEISYDHDKMINDFLKWKKHKGTFWSTK